MLDSKIITFMHAAALKSYTRAAEHLNLTQPAVTQHIKQLEEYFGVRLFKKTGRQIFLTEEGELLLKGSRELHADSLLLERKLRNKSAVTKRYDIGATLTIAEFVLPELLGQYKLLHNNTDVIMHVYNTEEVLSRLESGEFDLAVVEGPFNMSKYTCSKLKDDELVLAASPQSGPGRGEEIEIAEIINSGKLILREKGSGTRSIFENKLKDLGFNPLDIRIYMEVGSIGAIKSLVEANLGYTVISREAVRREVERKTLEILPVRGVKFMREFNFAYLSQGPQEFIKDFIQYIKDNT